MKKICLVGIMAAVALMASAGMSWAQPVIDTQPTSVIGVLGEDASWTVAASGEGLSYQWYYDPNILGPGNEVELIDGADYSGTETATLTLLVLEQTDIGKMFFCRITNGGGSVDTNYVTVNVPALVHYWPFDGNFNEVQGVGALDETYGEPGYETGVVGQALSVDRTNDGLAYSNVSVFFNFDTLDPIINAGGQSTMTFWMKSRDIAKVWASYFYVESPTPMMMGQHRIPGMIRYRTVLVWEDQINYGPWSYMDLDPSLAQDQWYFLAVRNSKNETAFFINGVPYKKITRDCQHYVYNPARFVLGVGDEWFNGAIDEFKIYNYPVSDRDIAQEYADITGMEVCVNDNPANIVEDGSCRVDLADFSVLAAQWLKDLTINPEP